MANTTNLNLEKPLGTDQALVSVINSNSDKIDEWAGTINQALATLTYTGTVANLQTSLVSLANSMSIGEFHNIKYTAGETLAPFSNSRIYGGTFKRTGSNYWSVTLEDPEGVPIYGTYKNGRWSWEQLAVIKQGSISVTITDTNNGFIDSGISSSSYMMLSAHTLASSNNGVRISNLAGGNYRFQIINAINGDVQKSGSIVVYFSYMQRY